METIKSEPVADLAIVEVIASEELNVVKRKPSSRGRKKHRFPCESCSKVLTSQKNLANHYSTKHKPKDFICDYEGKHFNTKDKLRLHIFQHRIYYRVQCQVCNKEYRTNQSMRKHLRTHFESHQCDTCGKTFRHKRLLQNHVAAIHQDDPNIPCNYCTRLFPNTTTRDAHHKTIHQDQQVNTAFFKCPDCPIGFEMKEELRIHSFIHYDGIIHTCLDCNQIFKKRKLLNNHMKKHEKPGFECHMCFQLFKYRSNLGKHLKENRCKGPKGEVFAESAELEAELAKQQLISMTVNPTKVKISSNQDYNIEVSYFKQEDEIQLDDFLDNPLENYNEIDNEIRIEDKTRLKTPLKSTKKPQERKKVLKPTKFSPFSYQCDLCDFTTNKKCFLLSHIRHHIASARHKCKTCMETFSTRMKLHNHSMKVHGRGVMGSVEYSKQAVNCPVCDRQFSEERLKFHIRLHDSAKWNCEHCAKIFRSQAALDKHLVHNHLSPKTFTCSYCAKSFRKMTILKQHEETHNPVKIYVVCDLCNKMMQTKSLKLHMEIKHGDRYKEKNFLCECGKTFRYQKQLDKHHESVHAKLSRGIIYSCPECKLAFNRRIELRNHSFEHYTGPIFACNCGMKFKKRKLLTIHSVVHKNYQWPCDQCSLTFQTRGGRRKHRAKLHGQGVEEVIEIPSYDIFTECK